MKIEKLGRDAADRPCPEGYYAHDGRGCVLMPPTGIMADGLRLATQAEVDRGPITAATVEHCANASAQPEAVPDGVAKH